VNQPPPIDQALDRLEEALGRLLEDIRTARSPHLDEPLDQLARALEAAARAGPLSASHADRLRRARDLYRRAQLALAQRRHEAAQSLQRLHAGRRSLRAYRS